MSALAMAAGVALGMIAGLVHLGVTRARAELTVSQRPGAALALLPVGFAAIAAAVVIAAKIDPKAAWLVPVGILVARWYMLTRLRRAS